MVLNDNFGALVAGMFRAPNTANGLVYVITDTSGISRNVRMITTSSQALATFDPMIQIGSGGASAQSDDIDIQTPFVTVPESQQQLPTTPVYTSGIGKTSTSTGLVSGGIGLIVEAVILSPVRATDSMDYPMLVMRDTFSSVGFSAGNTISLDYEVFI